MSEQNKHPLDITISKRFSAILLALLGCIWVAVPIFFLIAEPLEYSYSEKRRLATPPEISLEALAKGTYLNSLEAYAKDQFPLRDSFRSLKTASSFYGFFRTQDHGYSMAEGHLVMLDRELQPESITYAGDRFRYIYNQYLSDTNCSLYYCMIPDKNYFLHQDNISFPALSYEGLADLLQQEFSFASAISIEDTLTLDSFYRTDTHWRQETLLPVVQTIAQHMNPRETIAVPEYQTLTALENFQGVLSGHMGWNLLSEPMYYLSNETLEQAIVTHLENKNCDSIYDFLQLNSQQMGADPYSFYLSGATAIVTLENPGGTTGKELILFRDSFGSSIAPLFLAYYDTVTLIDIRYINPALLGDYVEFDKQDVLFLYSSILLNNSYSLKKER